MRPSLRTPLPVAHDPIVYGKYQLLELLAKGGMGEVWKARSHGVEGFEKVLVIKRILPELSAVQRFVDMFIDEAKIAVTLTHANIVQVFDLGMADGTYFMAMEYVPGCDLGTAHALGQEAGPQVPAGARRSTWSASWPRGSTTRTAAATPSSGRSASCTATFRPRTCCSASRARSSSPTSASRKSRESVYAPWPSCRPASSPTWRPSRRVRKTSTSAPTCSRWEPCCSSCSPARRRSTATRRSRSSSAPRAVSTAPSTSWPPSCRRSWPRSSTRAMSAEPDERYQNAGQLYEELIELPVQQRTACGRPRSLALSRGHLSFRPTRRAPRTRSVR